MLLPFMPSVHPAVLGYAQLGDDGIMFHTEDLVKGHERHGYWVCHVDVASPLDTETHTPIGYPYAAMNKDMAVDDFNQYAEQLRRGHYE